MASDHAKSTPIFWGHGSEDPLVKAEFSKESKEFVIGQLGVPVSTDAAVAKGLDYRMYNGLGHGTRPQELGDLQAWLTKAIPASD
jgi:predicted esterase